MSHASRRDSEISRSEAGIPPQDVAEIIRINRLAAAARVTGSVVSAFPGSRHLFEAELDQVPSQESVDNALPFGDSEQADQPQAGGVGKQNVAEAA